MIRIILAFLLLASSANAQIDVVQKDYELSFVLKGEVASSKGFAMYLGGGFMLWKNDFQVISTLGAEVDYTSSGPLFGPKVGLGLYIPDRTGCMSMPILRVSFYMPVDLYSSDKSMYLTPEIGYGILGLLYISAGYNIKLRPDSYSDIQGLRVTLGLNFPFLEEILAG